MYGSKDFLVVSLFIFVAILSLRKCFVKKVQLVLFTGFNFFGILSIEHCWLNKVTLGDITGLCQIHELLSGITYHKSVKPQRNVERQIPHHSIGFQRWVTYGEQESHRNIRIDFD